MKKAANEKPTIDSVIDQLLVELSKTPVDDDKYAKIVQNLDGLCKARSYKRDSRIPWEALTYGGISLLEMIMVLNFERLNVLPRALSYVMKAKP